MRSDRALAFETRGTEGILPGRRFQDGASQSGLERNHLFVNLGGVGFEEVSEISGADAPQDGRAFARLDYDRDGGEDLVVVNANEPLVQLFRNQVPQSRRGRVLALELVGANHEPRPAPGRSARDAVGAIVSVRVGERTLVRELRAGEGFGAQNSRVLRIGLGDADEAELVRIRWPSGRTGEWGPVRAGTRLTIHEDPAHSPTPDGTVQTPYRAASNGDGPRHRGLGTAPSRPPPLLPARRAAGPRLLTTFATWCDTCKRELPRLAHLRAALPQLELVGLPADEAEPEARVRAFVEARRPAYRVWFDVTPEERAAVRAWLVDAFGRDILPATLLLDEEGRVLATRAGVPTLSEMRRWLAESSGPGSSGTH